MKHNKLFSAAIVLSMIAFFTMSWAPSPMSKPMPVIITGTYTGGAYPTVTGTFTASGAIETSGTSTMTIHSFAFVKGVRHVSHCSQTLVAPEGTITILSNCQFSGMTGTWRIVSGTGAYANLRGNGKLIMTFPGAPVIVIEAFSGRVY
jgi:hypothetical protein